MKQYYIHDGNNQLGPYTLDQLKSMSLRNDTPVWFIGLGKWTTAEKVTELQSLLNSPSATTYATHNTGVSSVAFLNPAKRPLIRTVLIGSIAVLLFASALVYRVQQSKEPTVSVQQLQQKNSPTDTEQKNKKYRNNWQSYIGLAGTTYNAGKNEPFNIYVQNNSPYSIEQVELTVNYLKENGDNSKTEVVIIQDIPAHSEKTGNAPGGERAISVATKITRVRCTAMNFCFPHTGSDAKDPYFCK
jgi:hypothetical protein